MELLRWDCGIRVFYANPALNNFAYFFYKFSLFGVGTLNKINIIFLIMYPSANNNLDHCFSCLKLTVFVIILVKKIMSSMRRIAVAVNVLVSYLENHCCHPFL